MSFELDPGELSHATMAQLAPRLAAGAVNAEALVAACRARIADHDIAGAGLSALICNNVHVNDEARRLDAERRAHGPTGLLHGMPLVLKDNIDLAGFASTSGNPLLINAVAMKDAGQTRRLRQAGALILAKTNLSELSFEVRSRSSLAGDVLNPFNRTVTAGGSSGGTAAAIAAGFAIAGLGTDTGGSIRVPAAFNGLVGLRPTHGLMDMSGVAPLAPSVDTVGPIARCVADIARLLGVMTNEPRLTESLASAGVLGLKGARLGILRQAFGSDNEVGAAMEAAMAVMVDSGADLLDPIELPAHVLPDRHPTVVDWEFCPAFDAYLRENFAPGTTPASVAEIYASGQFLRGYGDSLRKRLSMGSTSSNAYRNVLASHAELCCELASLMSRYNLDGFIYPTSVTIPTSLDNPPVGWAPELAARCGWPALTLPAGRSASGVPIGLELMGRARSEVKLLRIAHDLESRLGLRMVPQLTGCRQQ